MRKKTSFKAVKMSTQNNFQQKKILSAIYIVISLSLLILFINKYTAYRSDHFTQVPMLMKDINPELFPRDYFLGGEGHYSVRKIYLTIQLFLYKLLGGKIELVLFSQYLLYLLSITSALYYITILLKKDLYFLILWILFIATFAKFFDFASVVSVEYQSVPRIYPYAASIWAIPLLMRRHYIVSGIILGLTGLVQGAPSLQALPILAVWYYIMFRKEKPIKDILFLILFFFLTYWPQFILLKGSIISKTKYSSQDVILFLAYIRHPHHMLPLYFETEKHFRTLMQLLFLLLYFRTRNISSEQNMLVKLVGVIIFFLLVSVFFIHVIPIASWIIFQPLRVFVLFYYLFCFFLAEHIINLLRSSSPVRILRGLLLMTSFLQRNFLPTFLIGEVMCMVFDDKEKDKKYYKLQYWAILAGMIAMIGFLSHKSKMFIPCGIYLLFILKEQKMADIIKRIKIPLGKIAPAVIAADIIFLLLLLCFPYKKWNVEPKDWNIIDKIHYDFASEYEVYPFPEGALEFAGIWAKQNTPKDSLFIIPPEREREAFHIWSERSVFFNIKMFPYVQSGWAEWIKRYFAIRGVLDPEKNPKDVRRFLRDAGGRHSDDDFNRLNDETLIQIADKFNVDYIISASPELLSSTKLKKIAGPFQSIRSKIKKKEDDPILYIYQPVKFTQ